MTDIIRLLTELASVSAPSGFENPVTRRAQELLEPFVDKLETDILGNVLGYSACGEENAPVLLIDAHLDEVGLMVTGYENGFLTFGTIGRIDPRMLPAREVVLHAENPVYGVVACLPPHVMSTSEMEKAPQADELYIDTGGVEVAAGTVGTFFSRPFRLNDKQFCAKALDDRSCFAVLLRALELIPAVELLRDKPRGVDIAVCGSVQEEVGLRGARTAAYQIRPDYALALDVTFGRTPDSNKDKTFPLGAGPCVGISPVTNRGLTDLLVKTAKECALPYQLEVMPGMTGTNADNMQISREGVATAVLSLPLKYMHSPVEVLDLDDFENMARLIAEWVVRL